MADCCRLSRLDRCRSRRIRTGVWTITTDNGDHVSTTYDRLGRTTSTTDQRGVVHTYTFDSAGRLSADAATGRASWGDVDHTVQAIGTAYDDLGRVQTVTSYADTAETHRGQPGSSMRYDGWGNLIREYQAHDGAVDTGSTPSVQYTYADGASGGVAKYVRLTDVIYPNGRDVQYGYGTTGAVDDIMSRLATISDSNGRYAAYKYLGAGHRSSSEDYVEASVEAHYLDSATTVTGLDRFGRVVDQLWDVLRRRPSAMLDEYTYTYDRAGNRTSRATRSTPPLTKPTPTTGSIG